MKLARAALATATLALSVAAAAAQSGSLTVEVTDSRGSLPGVTVTISHEVGYVATTSVWTDSRGLAEFPVLRPGSGYVVEISFPGYGTRREEDIRVRVNATTTLAVQLAEEYAERLIIDGRRDVVSLEKGENSTRFTEAFISDLPVPGRFYQNVLPLAPGVQDADGDGNPNVHGSRQRDVKAEVSGISNVDPLTGGYMSQVNPNSIEEMEVITSGAGVEFSRAQGAFVRILQKQGSNEFEGVFEFYYRSSKLDGDGAADLSNTPRLGFDWYQPSVQVSGPIVKDKLWYRLSHELIDVERPVNIVNGIGIVTREQGIHSDQITWQASPRNKLAFQFQSDPLELGNLGISSLVPMESARRYERTGETYALTWTAPLSPMILVESRVAWQDLNTGIFPSTSGVPNSCVRGVDFLESAMCRDDRDGKLTGSFFLTEEDHRQRTTARSDATVQAGRFWGMQHRFQFGMIVENERYFRHLEWRPNIDLYVYRALDAAVAGEGNPEPVGVVVANVAVPETANVTATGTTWGLYAEDRIKPLRNLTINLGLRVDREEINAVGREPLDPEAEFDEFQRLVTEEGLAAWRAMPLAFTSYEGINDFVAQLAQTLGTSTIEVDRLLSSAAQQSKFWVQTRRPVDQSVTNTNLSPRLAVAWDPWSDGKTKFAVTAGRYYDKIFLAVPLIELEPATTYLVWEAAPSAVHPWDITRLSGSINPAVNVSAVDRELSTPYQDELTLQFERELWHETSLKLSYVRRKFRDQLQDQDLNRAPDDLGRCRWATTADNSTVETVLPGDPDYDADYQLLYPGGDGIYPDDCSGELVIGSGIEGGVWIPWDERQRLQRPDGYPDLYIQNPGWGAIYVVGNFNSIDYTGYVLELVRRQYRSWEMQASYTWSKATGDGEDFNLRLGDDRSLLDDEQGYQSYDQRHVVKVNATTITPWGFRLGGSLIWQSGLPYSVIRQEISFDAIPPAFENLGGDSFRTRQRYETGRRNDQRNQAYWDVSLKFTKEMNLGRSLNLQISAEVFNLLNDGTYTIYNDWLQGGRRINGRNDAYRRFGRQWQLGLKMAF
jgi:hypothetical protein